MGFQHGPLAGSRPNESDIPWQDEINFKPQVNGSVQRC